MIKVFLFLYLVNLSLEFRLDVTNPIVHLPNGPVKGAQYKTDSGKVFYGFRGVPYAAAPVGDLRFEPPRPAKPWTETLDATNDGKVCISSEYFEHKDTQSEDCLTINIYTPNLNASGHVKEDQLSVLVWIYGGGFVVGDSTKWQYGPEHLIEEDVVVVSFNYRLGPFGFLSTADKSILGNNGLKDQNMALRWLKENIEFFGGNPEQITIFGQSAGGASVGLQIMSEKSAGLFRGAIVESGGALISLAVDENPRPYAFLLAESIAPGDYGNDTQKVKAFLKSRSVDEIQNAAKQVASKTGRQGSAVLEVDDAEAFVTKSHYEQMNSGKFNRVPTIIGFTVEESLAFLSNADNVARAAAGLDANPMGLIPNDLHQNASDTSRIIEIIKSFYLPNNGTFSKNWAALAEFMTVNMFGRGILKQVELQSKYVPVYLYQFAYAGRSWIKPFIPGVDPVGHSAELPFLFKMYGSYDPKPDNMRTQRQMTKLWANFAKYLNPTPEKDELLDSVIWPKIESGTTKYININKTLEIRSGLRQEAYNMWNKIYNTYGRKPFITF